MNEFITSFPKLWQPRRGGVRVNSLVYRVIKRSTHSTFNFNRCLKIKHLLDKLCRKIKHHLYRLCWKFFCSSRAHYNIRMLYKIHYAHLDFGLTTLQLNSPRTIELSFSTVLFFPRFITVL